MGNNCRIKSPSVAKSKVVEQPRMETKRYDEEIPIDDLEKARGIISDAVIQSLSEISSVDPWCLKYMKTFSLMKSVNSKHDSLVMELKFPDIKYCISISVLPKVEYT